MSWLVPDNASYNDTGHFSTYNKDFYYNEDSWRLAKNICWTSILNQKWQQSLDLDSFYSTDLDFGFSKKFNGFTFKTSDEMPKLSTDVNATIEQAEPCKKLVDKTFTKTVNSYTELYRSTSTFKKFIYQVKDGSYSFRSSQNGNYYVECETQNVNIQLNGTFLKTLISGESYSFYATTNDAIKVSTVGTSGAMSNIYFESEVESFYQAARDISNNGAWSSWHIDYSNCDEMLLVGVGKIKSSFIRTAEVTLTLKNDDYPVIAGVYVAGELKAYDIFSTLEEHSIKINLSNEDSNYIGQTVVMYAKRYYNIPLNNNLRKEIEETLKYSAKTYYTSDDFSNISASLGGIKNNYCIDTSGIALGELTKVSTQVNVSANRPALEDTTFYVNVLPRINSLPIKGCKVLDWNYTAKYGNFISPNAAHRVSGHFVATRTGTVTFNVKLSALKVFTDVRDANYYTTSASLFIYINGTLIYSYGTGTNTTINISVNKGDVIDVNTSGIYADSSYYSYEYSYAVVDRFFVDDENVTDRENGFVVYKDN